MSVFCLHRFALSTNPRIIPAEISRYRLLSTSVSLISRQPMKLQISFGFARAMPTTNPRTGMLWERDCSSAGPGGKQNTGTSCMRRCDCNLSLSSVRLDSSSILSFRSNFRDNLPFFVRFREFHEREPINVRPTYEVLQNGADSTTCVSYKYFDVKQPVFPINVASNSTIYGKVHK